MSRRPRTSATVLLVEDDVDFRDGLATALSDAGYEVVEADSAEAAVEVSSCFDGDIDLLLTDVVLPGMNGVELAGILVSRRPLMRGLFMSGYPDEVMRERGLPSARERFLRKPFRIDDLERKLRAELARGPVPGATSDGAADPPGCR